MEGAHIDAAIACVDAGVDVLVEKPLAPNLEGATRIVDAARDVGELAVVGIGNAIVDVISTEEHDFIAAHGLVKGAMTLIDAD
ncbi:MAG: Gfo/Idh/MocA family oxidoreductase, partial [bacterium]|nr:Gfo/Idh/MocA family oxidoreductase [bacterium]